MTYVAPTLTDGNVVLRRARPEDVEARIAAGNHGEIQHMYGAPNEGDQPVPKEQAQRWVRYHIDSAHSWFIDIKGQLGGVIFLHSFSPTDRRATLAMGLLRVSDLGQGYGTRALRLLVAEAFGGLHLHRLSLRVLSYNARAIAAYQKVGFQIEGVERQSARVGDVWHDDVMMGLLATDCQARA